MTTGQYLDTLTAARTDAEEAAGRGTAREFAAATALDDARAALREHLRNALHAVLPLVLRGAADWIAKRLTAYFDKEVSS